MSETKSDAATRWMTPEIRCEYRNFMKTSENRMIQQEIPINWFMNIVNEMP